MHRYIDSQIGRCMHPSQPVPSHPIPSIHPSIHTEYGQQWLPATSSPQRRAVPLQLLSKVRRSLGGHLAAHQKPRTQGATRLKRWAGEGAGVGKNMHQVCPYECRNHISYMYTECIGRFLKHMQYVYVR